MQCTMRKGHYITFILPAFFALMGCYTHTLSPVNSTWTEEVAIVIDGNDSEWQQPRAVYNGEQAVIGAMNDASYLYISLRTASQARIGQVLSQGLTVWFDPKGGKKKHVGIRYPIGSQPLGIAPMIRDRRGRQLSGASSFEDFLALQPRIEIIGPGKGNIALLPLNNKEGLEAGSRLSEGVFIYELKIPLWKDLAQPVALDIKPGGKIGIGFVTGPLGDGTGRWGRAPGGGGIGLPGGGGVGRPGGPGGFSGGRMGPPRPEAPELWISVILSEKVKKEN